MRILDKIISNYLEYKFKYYPKYPSDIARRKAELECRKEVDESLSTSRTNFGNREENKRIRILDDAKINECYKFYKGVEKTLSLLPSDKRETINERYWGEHSYKSWKEFADATHISISSAYRLRDEVLAIFAEIVGEY